MILILSDLHNRIDRADKIIKTVGADKIIFLGDYWDSWGDSHVDAYKTALWLKKSLAQPNRVHCIANHDCAYMFPNNLYTSCSGHQQDKQLAVDSIMTYQDWDKLKFFHVEQGWLFSHAGVHPSFLPKEVKTLEQIEKFLTDETPKALKALRTKESHWMFLAGRSRGGMAKHGGITWLDADEFEPISGLKTVQGHTPMKEPLWVGDNLFLDTHSNHYAILKDGKIETFSYADL